MKSSFYIGLSSSLSLTKYLKEIKEIDVPSSITIELPKTSTSFRKFGCFVTKMVSGIRSFSSVFKYWAKPDYAREALMFRIPVYVRAFDESSVDFVENAIIRYVYDKIEFNDVDSSLKYTPVTYYLLQSKYRKKKIPSRKFAVFRFS